MENTYEICYYGGMIAAIVLLLITIVLFFVLKIPRVFGELTGLTARRGVKNLKEKGTRSDAASAKEPKHYSQRTGAIKTRTADTYSSELSKKDNTSGGLVRGKARKKTFNEDENKTGFLGEDKITAAVTGDMAETAVLSQNEVENKKYGFVETGKLTAEAAKTEIDTTEATETEEMETDVLTAADVAKPVATGTEETFTSEEDEVTEVLSGPENASSGIGDDEPTEVLAAEGDDEPTEVLLSGTDDLDAQEDADEPTEVLAGEGDDEPTEVLTAEGDDEPTEVLAAEGDDEPTEVLTAEGDDEPTEVLTTDGDDEEEETVVLTSDEEETAVLTGEDAYSETSVLSAEVEKAVKKNYVVLYNVLEVHTSESL